MHIGNILGFGLLGLGMVFLPSLMPVLFPPEAGTGVSFSALWIEFMGWINGAVSGLLWVRYSLAPWLGRLPAWRPVGEIAQLRPAGLLRPAMELYGEIESGVNEAERSLA